MTLQACADIVAKGDPDRFAAAMAAPIAARKVLFPFYAFNVEVARAPWVGSEPLIGEMRLQWWADAVDEIAATGSGRRHEVATPLAALLDAQGAKILGMLVEARRRDISGEPLADEVALHSYLDATGGGLMWATARALGGTDEAVFRTLGQCAALANLFLAVPILEVRGRNPMPDVGPDSMQWLARTSLKALRNCGFPRAGRPAALAGWRAKALLTRVVEDPRRVARGEVAESEFRKRLSLLLATFRNS